MHDPSTVAFDIKYPWKSKPSKFWPKGHRGTFITIWHEDPQNFQGKCGCRSDDSCGWFSPPLTTTRREKLLNLTREQYSTIFEKQCREREGASYAYICFVPNAYDAVYWLWRAIKHMDRDRSGWQYGKPLSSRELDAIYTLTANPVDNVRLTVSNVQDLDSFESLVFTVDRAYRRFNRPWYRHPRWHVHHWRFQVHPLQKLHRRLFVRCDACRKPFGWNESPIGTWGGDKRWHSDCYHSLTSMKCEAVQGSGRKLADATPNPPASP